MTKILITSALPYINGVKHLGNLAGSLLPADVHARFHRQIGNDVLFLCGTDEHGTPAELAAIAAQKDVRSYCDRQHAIQSDLYRRFHLSFDHFGRSSSAQNHALTQHFYRKLDEAGLIDEHDTRQFWSPHEERFLPDRYARGTCPHCGSAEARGDQCDACGTLLEPEALIDPRSVLSGTPLQLKASRHLFLRQSLLIGRLQAWLDTRHGWPSFVSALAKSWLTADLRDRCITRDLAWGVPVPRPGFENKVFYVWFDAPIAYLAITQEWAARDPLRRGWRDWWQDEDIRYVQFLGKDNVPFHTVSFPATLIGSGEPWKTADVIKGFHWLAYEKGKFSTSRARGIFLDAALEEFPADFWRWWLIANAPETSDTDFTLERFAADVNKDLADILGNLVNRLLRFSESAFGTRIPEDGEPRALEHEIAAKIGHRLRLLRQHHETLAFRRAAAETRAIWADVNAYLQKAAPWSALASDRGYAAAATRTAFNLLRLCAVAAWSIVPALATDILNTLGESAPIPHWPDRPVADILGNGLSGRRIVATAPLVTKISPERIALLRERFAP